MFNKRLREMRIKRGYTQQRLADSVDIALRSYQCYETGTRTPCYDLLIRIADILDVSLDYLMGRDDFMKSHAIPFDEYL